MSGTASKTTNQQGTGNTSSDNTGENSSENDSSYAGENTGYSETDNSGETSSQNSSENSGETSGTSYGSNNNQSSGTSYGSSNSNYDNTSSGAYSGATSGTSDTLTDQQSRAISSNLSDTKNTGEYTGSTYGSNTGETGPWAETRALLQQMLGSLGGVNTGVSGSQESALAEMEAMAGQAPNLAPVAQEVAGRFLGSSTDPQVGMLSGGLDTLRGQLSPYASGANNDPYQNPATRGLLDTISGDITDRISGNFGAAGRDLSPSHVKALSRGLSEGTAPILFGQYNTNVGRQFDAANSLFGSNASTAGQITGQQQQALDNQRAGLGIAGDIPGLMLQPSQLKLDAANMAYGQPLQNIGMLNDLVTKIASLGTTTSGTQAGSASGASAGASTGSTTGVSDTASSGRTGTTTAGTTAGTTSAVSSGQSAGTSSGMTSGQSSGTSSGATSGKSSGKSDSTSSGKSSGSSDTKSGGTTSGDSSASSKGQSSGSSSGTNSGTSTGYSKEESSAISNLLSALMAGAALYSKSDARAKDGIKQVGMLFDGLPIYSFSYKGEKTPRIGLLAQDVEQVKPEAVAEFDGVKHVHYGKATERAREIGSSHHGD